MGIILTNKYIMDKLLEDIYNDNHGLLNRQLLYQKAKIIEPRITHEIVNEWFNKQLPIKRIQRPRIKKENIYHPIIADGTNYQADILILSTTKGIRRRNKGFIGLLTFINTSTRYLRVYPIKTHNFSELMPLFNKFISEAGNVHSITTDNEFIRGNKIKTINGIPVYLEEPGVHSKLGIINRVHRTIRDMIRTYTIFSGENRWINIINNIVWLYNNDMKHKALNKPPAKMTQEDIEELNERLEEKGAPARMKFIDFKIGDWVRHIEDRGTFYKGPIMFSKNTFMILDINGNSFTLWNDKGPAPRSYRFHELRKI